MLDALFDRWTGLPEMDRKRMEGEFQEIIALSCDAAMPAIIHEVAWQMRNEPCNQIITSVEDSAHTMCACPGGRAAHKEDAWPADRICSSLAQ